MKNYSKIYPLYRFEKNKGYPTKEHLKLDYEFELILN